MYNNTNGMEVLTLYPDISNLEREYNAAVAREQSLANRMLGAATWAVSVGLALLAVRLGILLKI